LFAPLIAPFEPEQANPAAYLRPPGWPHLMGTDATGLDVFSRVIYAPRIDLAIALAGTLISAFVGSLLGAAAGYYESKRGIGQFLSGFIMRSSDVLQAFPVFVFAIAVVAVLGQSLHSIVLAVAFVNAPIYLRLMRSQVLSVRRLRYVEAAFIAGTSDMRILARHVIPNAIAPVLAQLSVNIGWAILLTSALSFIGAGVEAPTPEWGSMIAMGYQNIITGHWWPSIFPGLALAVTIFGFSLIGSSIELLSDPARRRALSGQLGWQPPSRLKAAPAATK
jgi:peptide/nickel transport system permease protein